MKKGFYVRRQLSDVEIEYLLERNQMLGFPSWIKPKVEEK